MKVKERKSGLIVLFNSQYESFCDFHIIFATEKDLTYLKSDFRIQNKYGVKLNRGHFSGPLGKRKKEY